MFPKSICFLYNETHIPSFQLWFINQDFDWNVVMERDMPGLWMSPENFKESRLTLEADKSKVNGLVPCLWGSTQKPVIILEMGHFWRSLYYKGTDFPPLDECSRNPSVSVYQMPLLWEAALGLSELFLKTLWRHLPISWWVIYKRNCPQRAECSALFDQKQHDPMPLAPYSSNLALSDFFSPPGWKNSQREMFCWCRRAETNKQKKAEALKGINIDEFKNCFDQWEKLLDGCISSNGEDVEGDWSLNM